MTKKLYIIGLTLVAIILLGLFYKNNVAKAVSMPATNGLLAWYKFDEGSGAPQDYSGNGNHGVLGTGDAQPSWGSNPTRMIFDGDDHLSTGSDIGLVGDPAYTLEATAQYSISGSDAFLCLGANITYDRYACLHIGSTNNPSFITRAGFGTFSPGSGITNKDTWFHFVVTKAPGTASFNNVTMYINGELMTLTTSQSISDTPNIAAFPATIGKTGGNPLQHLTGSVKDIKVYNRVLSGAEVVQNCQSVISETPSLGFKCSLATPTPTPTPTQTPTPAPTPTPTPTPAPSNMCSVFTSETSLDLEGKILWNKTGSPYYYYGAHAYSTQQVCNDDYTACLINEAVPGNQYRIWNPQSCSLWPEPVGQLRLNFPTVNWNHTFWIDNTLYWRNETTKNQWMRLNIDFPTQELWHDLSSSVANIFFEGKKVFLNGVNLIGMSDNTRPYAYVYNINDKELYSTGDYTQSVVPVHSETAPSGSALPFNLSTSSSYVGGLTPAKGLSSDGLLYFRVGTNLNPRRVSHYYSYNPINNEVKLQWVSPKAATGGICTTSDNCEFPGHADTVETPDGYQLMCSGDYNSILNSALGSGQFFHCFNIEGPIIDVNDFIVIKDLNSIPYEVSHTSCANNAPVCVVSLSPNNGDNLSYDRIFVTVWTNKNTWTTYSITDQVNDIDTAEINGDIANFFARWRCSLTQDGTKAICTTNTGESFTGSEGIHPANTSKIKIVELETGYVPSTSTPVPMPTPTPTPPPLDTQAPTISNVSVTGVTTSGATINWTTDEPSTSQIEYGQTTSYGTLSTLNSSLATNHSITINGLSSGTTFQYRVRSKDANDNEAIGINRIFITNLPQVADTTPPSPITTLNYSDITQTSVDLTWIAQGGDGNAGSADSYDIRYSTSQITESNFIHAAQVQGEPLPQIAGTNRSYVLVGISPGTTYFVAIRSSDNTGNLSLISNVLTFTTLSASSPVSAPAQGSTPVSSVSDTVPPPSVSNFIAQGADSQVILSWINPTSSDFVRTIIIRKPGSLSISINDGLKIYEGTSQSFVDTGLPNGETFYYTAFTIDRVPNYSPAISVFADTQLGITQVSKEKIIGLKAAYRPSDFGLREGEVIGALDYNDPDVYIVNEYGYKRLFINPLIFTFYGHFGGVFDANKVRRITLITRDNLPTSGLFRNCEVGDSKIYAIETIKEDEGVFHHLNVSGQQALSEDPEFFKKVFCINTNEYNWYTENNSKFGTPYTSISQIPNYERK